MSLPPPEELDHDLCHADQVHRLAVAIGLSLPETEIPEVELPDGIADLPAPSRATTERNFIDKDQV